MRLETSLGVFDVNVRSKQRLTGVDVASHSEGEHKVLEHELTNVDVTDSLEMELIAKGTSVEQLPILSGVETDRIEPK